MRLKLQSDKTPRLRNSISLITLDTMEAKLVTDIEITEPITDEQRQILTPQAVEFV
jgi:hypothetical protein